MRRKDGSVVVVEVNSIPLFDEQGCFRGYRGFDRDITERKRSEDALRKSERFLAYILNSVPQSIFWKDRQSVYLGCNEVFARAVGLANSQEIVGKTDFDLPWPRGEAEAYRADDQEVMVTKQPKRHIVEPLQQADGSRIWVDTTKVPLLDAAGEVYGVLGVYDDITERKIADEALAESRNMLQLVLDTIPVRVFWKDTSEHYLGCNILFARDAGKTSSAEVSGKTDFDLPWPELAEMYQRDDQLVIASGEAKLNYEEPQTTPGGNQVWLRTSKIPLRDANGQIIGMLGVYEDITRA